MSSYDADQLYGEQLEAAYTEEYKRDPTDEELDSYYWQKYEEERIRKEEL